MSRSTAPRSAGPDSDRSISWRSRWWSREGVERPLYRRARRASALFGGDAVRRGGAFDRHRGRNRGFEPGERVRLAQDGVPVEIGTRRLARIAGDEQHREVAVERRQRSEEHTSELQSLMRLSYAVFCLKK